MTPAAACGAPNVKMLAQATPGSAIAQAAALFVSPAMAQSSGVTLVSRAAHGPITGLWKFAFSSLGNIGLGIPDGAPLDFGFQTWHDDGTELTNSGGQLPVDSNFCQGVWALRSDGSYRLNHWALGWNFDSATATSTYIGPVNIHENLNLSGDANTMTGTVSIDQYNPDQSAVIAHLTGTVVGYRIAVD